MSETKFTPGPWRICTDGNIANCVDGPSGQKFYERDDGFRAVATVEACTDTRNHHERAANMHANMALIAAAPELYAALEAWHAWDEAEDDHGTTTIFERIEMLKKAKALSIAALAKATFNKPASY